MRRAPRPRDDGVGKVYTRTGRPFFSDTELESRFLDRVRATLSKADFWKELASDWVYLDAELLPWSAKAQELLHAQYAAVGSASRHALADAVTALRRTRERNGTATALLEK